jgi:protein-L-isoaspartate(D-aspartate) O-methyltransferase
VTSKAEPDFAALRASMVERQLSARGIRDGRVLAAMGLVPREAFVSPEARRSAYEDEALPIGLGQTISQPYMVAATCELLGLDGSERVLDVGTGSGYAAAVLAELAAEVVTIERLPKLAERARSTLAACGYGRVDVRTGDGSLGVVDKAPFDAIAVAAAAPGIPPSLYAQLGPGGRIVLPVGTLHDQRLVLVVRTRQGPSERRSLPCRYVPLVGAEGFPI